MAWLRALRRPPVVRDHRVGAHDVRLGALDVAGDDQVSIVLHCVLSGVQPQDVSEVRQTLACVDDPGLGFGLDVEGVDSGKSLLESRRELGDRHARHGHLLNIPDDRLVLAQEVLDRRGYPDEHQLRR